jgi:hypothetical protein
MDEHSTAPSPQKLTMDVAAFKDYLTERLSKYGDLNKQQAEDALDKAVEETSKEMDGIEIHSTGVEDHVFHWFATAGVHEDVIGFPFGNIPLKDVLLRQIQAHLYGVLMEAAHENEFTHKEQSNKISPFATLGTVGRGYSETLDKVEEIIGSCEECRKRISLEDVRAEIDGTFNFIFRVILDFSNYHHVTVVVPCQEP